MTGPRGAEEADQTHLVTPGGSLTHFWVSHGALWDLGVPHADGCVNTQAFCRAGGPCQGLGRTGEARGREGRKSTSHGAPGWVWWALRRRPGRPPSSVNLSPLPASWASPCRMLAARQVAS